jgi:hypothetical protein
MATLWLTFSEQDSIMKTISTAEFKMLITRADWQCHQEIETIDELTKTIDINEMNDTDEGVDDVNYRVNTVIRAPRPL